MAPRFILFIFLRISKGRNTMKLVYQDAVDLAKLIKERKISCKELMQAFLNHQHKINPAIGALIEKLPEDEALKLAQEADANLAKGHKPGPLFGLPMAPKEMLGVKGWKSTYCWEAGVSEPALAFLGFNQVHQEDSILASRMREAGALFIGKTNMPPFAFGSHTKNSLYGNTRNPYDLSKSAGGSSGGAAAALATGMLPIADGSDLGGSLRNPAAFCNVIGFRPSIGRVPMLNAGWEARIGTEGPMARSVKDIALLLSAQAGPHSGDPMSIQQGSNQFLQPLDTDVSRWKLGWTSNFGQLPIEKALRDVFDSSLSYFEAVGVTIENKFPNVLKADQDQGELDAMAVFKTLRIVNIAPSVNALRKTLRLEGIRKYMTPVAQHQMIEAFEAVDAAAIFRANENRKRIYQVFLDYFEDYDFLICPSSQVLPFDLEMDYVKEINGVPMNDYLDWMSICCVISITGLPSISMPAGFSENGLPVGLQIVGKPGADMEVLQLAYAYEQASQLSAKYLNKRPNLDFL